jgi:hypothetical protein
VTFINRKSKTIDLTTVTSKDTVKLDSDKHLANASASKAGDKRSAAPARAEEPVNKLMVGDLECANVNPSFIIIPNQY